MIKILIGLLITLNLYANVEVSQNIRALYRGVKLTEIQENYILDTQDNNIYILEKALNKKLKTIKSKYIEEKNVISFILTSSGEIKHIKFLQKSDNRKIDKMTKKVITQIAKKFTKPQEDTIMRYIISFKKGQITYINPGSKTIPNRNSYNSYISRGTTRFQYSSKEYVREFETNEDGFVNVSTNPQTCATLRLLTHKNQKINTGYTPWQFNTEVPKGKYKLLIKTKKTCDVSIEYL